ncbi:uncharacterized protein FIBRA_02952 [Fibroporia radiculosa]|uniref:Uncharacterized protein n=1 Tax=Fibroporia radiculosa TaxID=599839 RepID=J4I9C2_9APHY|nr:uncharacterized protein FIBRA_02952 [Fibroporia radiculosa]CCM00906.1 predicted protein [Fibroporia radiculosa]
MAVVVAFISSILDLVQMLVRGSAAVDQALDLNSVSGLIIVREVGFSLSFGLRFLFYWGFVASPPPGEIRPSDKAMHNGSWGRWGAFGIFLEMLTLTLTLTDPVLQILYRNINALHEVEPLYEVEAAIQIVLSAIFLLKLLLNCWVGMLANPSVVPTRKKLLGYSAPISALSLSILIGIGNVAMFEFTETVLGRFMQAVEFYILIVYMLTSAFYHLRRPSWSTSSSIDATMIRRKSSFRGLPEMKAHDLSLRITPPVIVSPDLLSVVGQNVHGSSQRPSLMQRFSASSRLSTWLNMRRYSGRPFAPPSPTQDQVRLWSQDQAERGYSPDGRDIGGGVPDSAIDVDTTKSFNQSLGQPLQSAKWQDPVYTSVIDTLRVSNKSPSSNSALVTGRSAELHKLYNLAIPPPTHPRQMGMEPVYVISPVSPSAYGSPTSAYGSPVPGPDDGGIEGRFLNQLRLQPTPTGLDSARSSRISELIRQQAELDQSIAALRVLSPSNETFDLGGLYISDDRKDRSADRTTRSTTQSDLSLSNFPAPPQGRSSIGADMPSVVIQPNSAAGASQIDSDGPIRPSSHVEIPNLLLATDQYGRRNNGSPPSVIDMDTAMNSNRHRIDSGGTQYEITSFIGGLTHTEHSEPGSFSSASILNNSDEGHLPPPRFPISHVPSDSFGSLASRCRSPLRPADTIRDEHLRPAAPSSENAGRTFQAADRRFTRPVGLPPRPRLTAADMSPATENPAPI